MTTNDTFSAALSPLDGRYRRTVEPLARWLSEEGLNQTRIEVEVAWMAFALAQGLIPGVEPLTEEQIEYLLSLDVISDAETKQKRADLEAETQHDVKAIEYLVRNHMEQAPSKDLSHLVELVHFLCTSEDINNLAQALTVQRAVTQVWLPAATGLLNQVNAMASEYAQVPMIARTHGQPATPTTLGKELKVFSWRMKRQLDRIAAAEYFGKFNGATGTYSAHATVLPDADWLNLSQEFVESLGLEWNPVTTQIEPHDWQVELYDSVIHFNRVAHDLATDCWSYISLGYFQQATEGSTGSSTMPHKVNPIRFENAEANLEMSDGVFEVLTSSLSTTRLQRDLSDSSIQRNVGVAFGYSLLAIDNLTRGLKQLTANAPLMAEDLERHPEVLSEVIQQALRFAALVRGTEDEGDLTQGDAPGKTEPYLLLKELTRGRETKLEDLREVVDNADLPKDLAKTLREMTPATYVGLAAEIADL